MIVHQTKLPTGSSPESVALRRLNEAATFAAQPQSVGGMKINRTTRGPVIVAASGGTTASVTKLKRYKLKDVKGDYLVCRTWNGTSEGTVDIYIAKEDLHRESLTTETILGEEHSYTFADGPSETWTVETAGRFNRTRTDGTEDQRIVPPWRENEVIHAISADTGIETDDGKPINLLIVGRSCQWAKVTA